MLVRPVRATLAVPMDADDPAIWINRADPSRSLILGTAKSAAPDGALAVFALDGTVRQLVTGLDRPNNVDVEYGFSLRGIPTDVAVVTERLRRRLRAFTIAADGSGVSEASGESLSHILDGAQGEEGAPMGIALYRRPDGAIFAIVAPKAGPRLNYLWQYRLVEEADGRIGARLVRR